MVINAIAVGLLAVSVVAAAADPLPARFSASLPTFAGVRERAAQIRSVENASAAIHAFERYLKQGGDPRRFDATVGNRLAPGIPWASGASEFEVDIDAARAGLIRFVVEWSGTAACVQARDGDGWRPTYGTGDAAHPDRALETAIARCGDTPLADWHPSMPPVDTMCDGLDRDGIVVCRAVQFQVRRQLTDPFA